MIEFRVERDGPDPDKEVQNLLTSMGVDFHAVILYNTESKIEKNMCLCDTETDGLIIAEALASYIGGKVIYGG